MDIEKIRTAREKVEKIFKELSETPIENKKEITIRELMKYSGITIDELGSPRYLEVMRAMGDEEHVVLLSFKMLIPIFTVELAAKKSVSYEKAISFVKAYEELASAYTYAIIKLGAKEDVSEIHLWEGADTKIIDHMSHIEKKVMMILMNYCVLATGIASNMLDDDSTEYVRNTLVEYISSMRNVVVSYVVKARKQNSLKEEQ